MNNVTLIGRLTRDPEVRVTERSQVTVANFNLAINRGKDKNGQDMGADFPRIVCYGKTAENVQKYCKKGMPVAITGRIHTDSYDKDGAKVYTTDIQAERVEFLGKAEDNPPKQEEEQQAFMKISDDDLPF